MVSQKPKYCKIIERNYTCSHWRKISMIMVWERYCNASPKPVFFFTFFVYIFIHISANMSPFGLKFSQMILHIKTSKLMYKWSFLFVVLHKPTLLPSTFKDNLFHKYLLNQRGVANIRGILYPNIHFSYQKHISIFSCSNRMNFLYII